MTQLPTPGRNLAEFRRGQAKSLSKILRIRRRSCPSMQGGSFDIHQVPRVGWVGKKENSSLAWRGKGHQRPIPKPRSQPRTACFSPSERAAAALGKRDQSVSMASLPAKLCPAQNWPLVLTWRPCALFGALLSHEMPAPEEPGNHHFFHVTQFHRGAPYSLHRSLSPHWCATVSCVHLPRSSSHSPSATSSARARTGISFPKRSVSSL